MKTTFNNVMITIEAASPEEAYQKLNQALLSSGITAFETLDFTDDRDGHETAHSVDDIIASITKARAAEPIHNHFGDVWRPDDCPRCAAIEAGTCKD